MEIIIILLGLITLFLWFIQRRLNEYINYNVSQEYLDYPLYSKREIYFQKIKCEHWEKEMEKFHHPDPVVYKEHNKEREVFRAMLEGNFAIRSGKKTFGQVAKENLKKIMDLQDDKK